MIFKLELLMGGVLLGLVPVAAVNGDPLISLWMAGLGAVAATHACRHLEGDE